MGKEQRRTYRIRRSTMARDPRNIENVYQFVRSYLHEHSYAPSLREIGAACDLSIPTVSLCLAWLEAQHRLRRSPGKARSIVLLDMDEGTG